MLLGTKVLKEVATGLSDMLLASAKFDISVRNMGSLIFNEI